MIVDDEGIPQLTDFGRSKLMDHLSFAMMSCIGTIRYMAPELIDVPIEDVVYVHDQENSESLDEIIPQVTRQTDIYAFAMTALEVRKLFCILFQNTPQ